ATPGLASAEGMPLLAALGLGWWASRAARPFDARARRGRLAEWLAGALAMGPTMGWTWYVWPPTVLYMGAGLGLYTLLAAALLRAAARRLSLPLALPIAWTGMEVLRSAVPPPAGLGWLSLGHYAHHHLWLAGSARVWGVEGVGFALAALAGLLAAALAAPRRLRPKDLLRGLGPAALGAVLVLAVPPPDTVAGPRLLLVQPGFSQKRKQTFDPAENFQGQRNLTHSDLARRAQQGEAPPDLVCWGESMLFVPLFESGVPDALAQGARLPPWADQITPDTLADWQEWEAERVGKEILGLGLPPGSRAPRLPAGTSFLSGADTLDVVDGAIRRKTGVVLYSPDGSRAPVAGKRYLVPGAETMLGLERFAGVRAAIHAIAGYVPDLAAAPATGVLELATRGGRHFRLGATVCFDNAFLPPYVEPLAETGGLDFHLVASNEAWYLRSGEVDQMVAFSRLIALSTGRAVVRATNSGISIGIDPDGRERGRVREEGRDRLARGTLLLDVPVPAGGPTSAVPPYVRLRSPLRVVLGALALALLVAFRGPIRYPAAPGG
ncbi:MAG: apolipoprotein N-acyltransferase, partial [Planctomycetota bacterium]